MKKITLVLMLLLCATAGFAQQKRKVATRRSDLLLNLGVGVTNYGIPIYGGLEGYVHPDITVGGVLGYQHYNDGWRGYDYRVNLFTISAVGNYHFNRILELDPQWDLYAGLNLGFGIWSYNRPEYAPDYARYNSPLFLGLQAGARYYFSPKWGINAELAGGSIISWLRIGVTCKL